MIVYQADKAKFVADVASLGIEYQIAQQYLRKTGRYALEGELRAWREDVPAKPGRGVLHFVLLEVVEDRSTSSPSLGARTGLVRPTIARTFWEISNPLSVPRQACLASSSIPMNAGHGHASPPGRAYRSPPPTIVANGFKDPATAIAVMTASDRRALQARWLSTLARESGIEVSDRPVTDATCLATTLERRHPTVLLLDKALLDRLDPPSLRRIRRCLDVHVILVAERAGHGAIADVLRNRFRGLLLTTSPPDLLLKAIRAVSKGELWLSRGVMTKLLTDLAWPSAAAEAGASAGAVSTHAMAMLSRRESQIVAQLQRGCSNKEIARELGIMEDTVKKHLKNIFAKLGVHRRALVVLQVSSTSPTPGTRPRRE